jgi:hypothetical protein
MIDDSRVTYLVLGKEKIPLLLTLKATREIATRYGGLEELGNKMLESMDLTGMIDEIVWLIVVLANQCILIENLENKTNKPLLTANELELKMDPYDVTSYREAILAALQAGQKQHVQSEEEPKNA